MDFNIETERVRAFLCIQVQDLDYDDEVVITLFPHMETRRSRRVQSGGNNIGRFDRHFVKSGAVVSVTWADDNTSSDYEADEWLMVIREIEVIR